MMKEKGRPETAGKDGDGLNGEMEYWKMNNELIMNFEL